MELGVNYKGLQANWDADIAVLKAAGVTCIRPNLASLPTPWAVGSSASGGYAYWRNMAAYFKAAGFWITWGPSNLNGVGATQMTATKWIQYHDTVVAEAAYCQSIGLALDVFELGNEMESTADTTTLTVNQMITNLRTLATDVRAVYPLAGKIGYSPWDYAGTTYDQWILQGLGGLDVIEIHPYSNIVLSAQGLAYGGYSAIPKMIKAFGPDKCYISEFGLEGGDANLQSMSKQLQVASMRDRYFFMKNLGFKKVVLYTFCGYLNTDNQFAMQHTDGSYEPMWSVLTNLGKRIGDFTSK